MENFVLCYGRRPSIFIGDPNVNAVEEHLFTHIQNLLLNYDFHNCHELVTRPFSNICLDLEYTNILKPINVNAIECNLSDLNLIHCSVDYDLQKCYSVCDYERFYVCIREHLESCIYSQDVSVNTNNFWACISNAIESSIVSKYENIVLKRKITPWVNGNLLINCC